ncbi:aminopeptidase N [Thalassotalea maritima]|uniref:aminopeptidase N n=1 Tax=Thalassotalea maritima TaxID=3242416 RepID=UPI00352768D9
MTDFTPRYLKDYSAPDYTISDVSLEITLDDHKTLVSNTMQVVRQNDAATSLSLDGEHLRLLSVSVDGKLLSANDYQLTDSNLVISDLAECHSLNIVTEIDPKGNSALEGIYKSGDVFCSQCEAEGFRRITYYLDRPDVLAIFTTKIIGDKQAYPYMLANGNKVDSGELDNGQHFAVWHDPFPKPSYLFALVAGDFDLLEDRFTTRSGRDVALQLFVDHGNLARAEHAMESLKKSMAWDEQVFDLEYDLDIYMIVAVDFFNMGAMENKGLNIFNSKYVLADDTSATDDDFFNVEAVIAHEYFHNWTGNRVTCRDWFQLSLKEGLTVFRDQQFSADMHSAAVNRIKNVRLLRSHQFAEDAGPMAHPIRPEKVVEMNNFYTLTVYEKGAEVIRMLHTILGEQGFKKGIDLYFARHDGQAVTCDDFVAAMSDANNADLSLFSHWYRQSGTPELIVSDQYDANSKLYQLTIEQVHPATADKQDKHTLHIPVNIELLVNQQSTAKRLLQLKQNKQTFTFENIEQQPIPVLLGNFSAPVRCHYQYTDAQLMAVMMYADDAFNRWDAGQQLFARYIKQLVVDSAFVLPDNLVEAMSSILQQEGDNALKAEQLTLPDFAQMADSIAGVEPQQLINAIKQLKTFIAKALTSELIATYQGLVSEVFAKDGQAIANRALKNACLSYLAYTEHGDDLAREQFSTANNMTDEIAALQVVAANDLPSRQPLLTAFEDKWRDNTLVMDKWFTTQAMVACDNSVEHVQSLLSHPLFSYQNPNRARALIAGFAVHNPQGFHQVDGKGYQWLAEQIIKLNDINPQVASRLITPLIQFKSFAKPQQALMRTQLERINGINNLSRDLQEKLTAALQ